LQTEAEIGSTGATNEVAVGILAGRQGHDGDCQTLPVEPAGERLGSVLARLIVVLVKDEVNVTTRPIEKLTKLGKRQLRTEGARGVSKASLPQDREIE
jgi:hypothetical protein